MESVALVGDENKCNADGQITSLNAPLELLLKGNRVLATRFDTEVRSTLSLIV